MGRTNNHTDFRLIEGQSVAAWRGGVDPLLADLALHLASDAEPLFHKM